MDGDVNGYGTIRETNRVAARSFTNALDFRQTQLRARFKA
jgi:hypothetical protein